MVTELGKYLRKLRVDKGLRLFDMAEHLGKSTAWLSYIENGRKKIPQGFADKIAEVYSLPLEEVKKLHESAAKSAGSFKLNVGKNSSKVRIDTAYALARKFDDIDDDTLGEFLKILKEKK